MPNHVTNRITSTDPGVLQKLRNALKGEGDTVDFNRVIPTPDDIFQGDLTADKQRETKGRNWYDWNTQNWGTKWNAYQCSMGGDAIVFQTAWSCPEPVIRKLAEIVAGPWIWEYADEDIGSNLGTFHVSDRKTIPLSCPTEENDRIAFACRVTETDEEGYRAMLEEGF